MNGDERVADGHPVDGPPDRKAIDSSESEIVGSGDHDPMSQLPELLGRPPTAEEVGVWTAMAPSHRDRVLSRAALLDKWLFDRGALTAATAAAKIPVSVKYFYEMASAWKRTRTLAALGAFTTAKATRGPRIDAEVTNAIQANVARVVTEGEGLKVEELRRRLEEAARETLALQAKGGKVKSLPSARTVRTFIEREIVRREEAGLPGAKLVADCCPVTMRRADGTPHILFAFIDRGTGLLIGHALGDLYDSPPAYARAAAAALSAIAGGVLGEMSWARTTERLDITFGEDLEASRRCWERYRSTPGLPELGAIERPNRFGGAYRRIVGDRVGRVQFRPTWLSKLPPLEEGAEVFDDAEAALRADADVAAHNRDVMAKLRKGRHAPPENMLAALRFFAG